MFIGDHGPSSDGYYDWYVKQIGASGFVFHICAGEASKCKAKKARGDARELIHIDKWRMLTPKLMLQHEYMVPEGLRLGEEELIKMARDLKGPAPLGTGLDVARKKLAEKVEKEDGGPAEALGAEPELGLMLGSGSELRSKKRGREPMGDFLAKQASKQQAAGVGERKGKKKKKKKFKGRKEGEVSLTPSSSSEESSSFHAAPVRGGKELWRVAQKKPGPLQLCKHWLPHLAANYREQSHNLLTSNCGLSHATASETDSEITAKESHLELSPPAILRVLCGPILHLRLSFQEAGCYAWWFLFG